MKISKIIKMDQDKVQQEINKLHLVKMIIKEANHKVRFKINEIIYR